MDLFSINDTQIGAVLLAVAIVGLLFLTALRGTRRHATGYRSYPQHTLYGGTQDPYFGNADAARQLTAVMGGTFRKKRLMNATEYRVFAVVERALAELKQGHRLFAQTSLGEVLESVDAHYTINAKRIDILIVDRAGWPVLAIECQGAGHYQGNAAARDAIKKEALRRADVAFMEFTPDDSDSQIRLRVQESLTVDKTMPLRPPPKLAAVP